MFLVPVDCKLEKPIHVCVFYKSCIEGFKLSSPLTRLQKQYQYTEEHWGHTSISYTLTEHTDVKSS